MSGVTLERPAAYFDRLAIFEADHWWSAMLWRVAEHWLDSRCGGQAGLDALDVGCGAGLTLSRLASRPQVGQVVGVDPSREAIAHARGRGDFLVAQGTALGLPFDPGSFDLVTCFDVLQHLPPGADRVAASEIVRVLRPHGLAILRCNTEGGGLAHQEGLFDPETARVVRASHVNMVGSLAQEVWGRLRPTRLRPHPSGGGLPLTRSRGLIHRGMAKIGGWEALAVGRFGVKLPFGHSTMLLIQKSPSRRPD